MIRTAEKSLEYLLRGQKMLLHAHKALFWTEKSTLMIADMHLGKSMHFRKSGIAIPREVSDLNWIRFRSLLDYLRPESVIFLGDLFHSVHNCEWNAFSEIIEQYAQIRFQLIIGNHDILDQAIYRKCGLETIEQHLLIDEFILSHYPLQNVPEGFYNLSGHIHPGVKLRGQAKQGVKLPCFYFGPDGGILPAFGAFTGCALIKPTSRDAIMVIVNDQVIRVQ
jgi:DNA ligase-associated metallophosphoesterase